ncbi:MAG: glutathione peroxidase [Actinomycetes bacterium]
MALHDIELLTLDGSGDALDAARGKVTLVVNVASQCGLTPQYSGLQALHESRADQGFTVLGVPCNQFLEQEPGTPDEIAVFCETNYGVTFLLAEKVEVNGDSRHPLYDVLVESADVDGHTGDVRWNFEKFLVDTDGNVVARFAPTVEPDDAALVAAIDELLADA